MVFSTHGKATDIFGRTALDGVLSLNGNSKGREEMKFTNTNVKFFAKDDWGRMDISAPISADRDFTITVETFYNDQPIRMNIPACAWIDAEKVNVFRDVFNHAEGMVKLTPAQFLRRCKAGKKADKNIIKSS
jgi:hypothetical protein